MKTMLHSLMQLQSLDNKLLALEALKGDLPEQIQKLKDDLQNAKEHYQNEKELLSQAKKTRLHWEMELKAVEDNLKRYQDQLYAVTSNKEYDAITIEIDATKEKIGEAETKILELIEEEETRTEAEKSQAARIRDLETHLVDREKELNAKIAATEQESVSYINRRKELVSTIQRPILYQYERIRKGLGNNAVTEIKNYACGRCLTTIPPQKVVEIRMMNQLILCESCGRILVHRSQDEVAVN